MLLGPELDAEYANAQGRMRIRVPATQAGSARGLTAGEASRVMAEAVFAVQAKMTTWAKADLIRHLGEALPVSAMADRAALETLADRMLRGGGGGGVAFCSGMAARPGQLAPIRWESVFRPHGAERYASQAQLTAEERLKAQAQAIGAPRLERQRNNAKQNL